MPRHRWAKVRREVLDRDSWRCQECGKPGRLEVHHIRALEHGGKRFDDKNLITICREHHIRIHGGIPHTIDPGYAALVAELLP